MFKRFGFGALAAISLAMSSMLDFRSREIPLPKKAPEPYKAPHGKRSGRQRSSSKGAADRLILDRSNNVRKIQRWLNNGSLIMREPRPAAVNRHKVRRVEIQRAKNLAAHA